MSKPIAVLISDIHYKLDTLEVADASLRAAIDKGLDLDVPVIDCGDLTNDKAILRAEVVNKLLETRKYALDRCVNIISLVGNHSLINEKDTTHNAINFLRGASWSVIHDKRSHWSGVNLIPYQPTPELFLEAINTFPKGSIVIAHQGIKTGNKGDYIQDHSAVDYEDVKDWKVFSGHYHQHQVLGNWVYIGNPYTLSFVEANDGPKGYLVLYNDGSFERVILPFRKHVIVEMTAEVVSTYPNSCQMEHPLYYVAWKDKLWIKVSGTASELSLLTKDKVSEKLGFLRDFSFKLDKIPTDSAPVQITNNTLTNEQILDKVIDATGETEAQKIKLKALWRELCS